MPKARNEKIYNSIVQAAHQQFLERGYDVTTYQSIASACDQKRNIVQYYFPQKTSLAVSFFQRLLSGITTFINDNNLTCENEYATMLRIGYFHFYFLLKDEKTKRFATDVLRSRELTEKMLLFDIDWGMEFLEYTEVSKQAALREEIIYAMGGFYELMYVSLKNGTEINVEKYLRRVVTTIVEVMGKSHAEALSMTEAAALSSEVYDQFNAFCQQNFMGKC